MLSVRPCALGRQAECERWDAFVASTPGSTFFHRVGWAAILEEVFGFRVHYLQALRGDQLVGILPLAEVRSRLFGHSFRSLPLASAAGVLAIDAEAASALIQEAARIAESSGAAYVEIRHEQAQAGLPSQLLYVDFRMPLPEVMDERMLVIPQKRRNMVRKAIKQGLSAVRDDSVEKFFPVFAENARDHGTPTLPQRLFDLIVAKFGADVGILSVADAAGRRVSSIMCFFHRGVVIAHFAGESAVAKRLAANDLKYWEVMKWARERGCTEFDIGRSKQGTGSFEFKRLWGFTPYQLHYEYVLLQGQGVPQLNPTNPKYRIAVDAWKRMPLVVANWLGPRLVGPLV